MSHTTITTVTTVTDINAQELADDLNAAFIAGTVTHSQGHELYSPWPGRVPFTAWQNGTLSFTARTKARTPGKTREVFVKVGQHLSFS